MHIVTRVRKKLACHKASFKFIRFNIGGTADFSWMNRNSLCHAEQLLDLICGRIDVSMMCRILVIISPGAYQPR